MDFNGKTVQNYLRKPSYESFAWLKSIYALKTVQNDRITIGFWTEKPILRSNFERFSINSTLDLILVFAEVDFRKSEHSIKNFKQNRTTLKKELNKNSKN